MIKRIIAPIILLCLFHLLSVAQTSWDWSREITSSSYMNNCAKLSIGNNNIYFSGVFSESMNLGGNNYFGNDQCTAFLASYLPNGQLQWLKKSGEPFTWNLSNGIMVKNIFSMPNDDVVLFGDYSYSLVFDNIVINVHPIHPGSSIFAFRFNSSGTPTNAININAYNSLESSVACTDNQGNLYLSAFYNDSVFVNGSDTLIPVVDNSVFIAKFNAYDSLINTINMTSSNLFRLTDIHYNQNGDLYIYGWARDTISVSGITFGYNNTTYSFIAKLNDSGIITGWIGFINNLNDELTDMEIIDNKIYITGSIYGDSICYNNTFSVYPDSTNNLLFASTLLSLDTIVFRTNLGRGKGVKIAKGFNGAIYLDIEKYNFVYDPFFDETTIEPASKIFKLTPIGTTVWSTELTVPPSLSSSLDMVRTPFEELIITGTFGGDIGFGSNVFSGSGLYLAKLNQVSNININGHVFNNATPVANAQVDFFRYEGNVPTSPIGTCFTDVNGYYNYNTTTTGNYFVRAMPDLSLPNSALAYPLSSIQWFNSAGFQVLSDTIITADISLNQFSSNSGPNSIHGYIKDPYGNPLSQIKVNLIDNTGALTEATFSDNNGFYAFSGISSLNYSVFIDLPFLPMLNNHFTTDFSLDYNYMVFSNFIDTGSQYLPQPTDTVGINLITCEIIPSIPVDSAFASVIGFFGGEYVAILIQIYQLENVIDTVFVVPYSETGLNVLLVNYSCDSLQKSIHQSTLQFLINIDPLYTENNIIQDESFVIYPNPCSDLLSVMSKSNSLITTYEIFDYTGKLITSNIIYSENNFSVPLSNYPKGYYILKLTTVSGFVKYFSFIKN